LFFTFRLFFLCFSLKKTKKRPKKISKTQADEMPQLQINSLNFLHKYYMIYFQDSTSKMASFKTTKLMLAIVPSFAAELDVLLLFPQHASRTQRGRAPSSMLFCMEVTKDLPW
jgi:hypothetical protein